jgi:hypothetical protein
MEFTAKEKRAIDKAWSQLCYVASYSMGAPVDLNEALKYERASRGITRAKAILVENAVKGIEQYRSGEELTASELFGFGKGCAYARMLGGDVARRVSRYSTSEGYGLTFMSAVSDLVALGGEAGIAFEWFRDRALAEALAGLAQAVRGQ